MNTIVMKAIIDIINVNIWTYIQRSKSLTKCPTPYVMEINGINNTIKNKTPKKIELPPLITKA